VKVEVERDGTFRPLWANGTVLFTLELLTYHVI
jgi:hypothetical protein